MAERDLNHAAERSTLARRARELALRPAEEPPEGSSISVLRFTLGLGDYAVERDSVRRVIPLPRVTPLPGVPPFMLGIINVRSRMVALLDLKPVLGLAGVEAGQGSSVIILHADEEEFGFVADAILGVAEIPRASLQTAIEGLPAEGAEYFGGATAEGLVLLDARKLLASRSLVVDEAVGRPA